MLLTMCLKLRPIKFWPLYSGQETFEIKKILPKLVGLDSFWLKWPLGHDFFFDYLEKLNSYEKNLKKNGLNVFSRNVTSLVNLAKMSFAKTTLWPKCLWLKSFWPKCLCPKCLLLKSVVAKKSVPTVKQPFWPGTKPNASSQTGVVR